MFKDFIKDINKILVVGHLGPDPDAYASILLLGQLIKHNYPKKEVVMLLDTKESLEKISFLRGFDKIEYGELVNAIDKYESELVVFVDGSDRSMYTKNVEALNSVLERKKTANFDHHQAGETSFDYYLREERFSCTDVIFEQLVKREGWNTFVGYEEIYLTGVISDSARFYYKMDGYRDTFNNVADILDKGYTIREVSDRIFTYSKEDFAIFNIFNRHITYCDNYVYSYITPEEYENEIKNIIPDIKYKLAKRTYIDNILNNIEGIKFSYILSPSINRIGQYGGSIRSKLDGVNCSKFAQSFDGGGHITGAGFNVISEDFPSAIKQVNDYLDANYEDLKL